MLDLRRLELDKRDEVLPQVDRVDDEQETGHGLRKAAAALGDGKRRHGALVGGSDVGLVGEGMHVSKRAEQHFDADANVLNAVGDVVGGEVPVQDVTKTKWMKHVTHCVSKRSRAPAF